MDTFFCILFVLALAVLLRWAVIRQLEHAESPEYFRRHGVIIKRLEALDTIGEVVGRYLNAPIYRSLGFKGMDYEFAGVVSPGHQHRIDESELYLEPGLLYLTTRAAAADRLRGSHTLTPSGFGLGRAILQIRDPTRRKTR